VANRAATSGKVFTSEQTHQHQHTDENESTDANSIWPRDENGMGEQKLAS
jgi:hypothetical protein